MAAANWDALLRNIKNGDCVPFLGAGACYPALPRGADLAAQVLNRTPELKAAFPFEQRTDLAKVTQFAAALTGDAPGVKLAVAEALREHVVRVTSGKAPLPEVHKSLAQLGLPLYITTNYDELLEHALRVAKVDPQSEICRWTDDLLAAGESQFDQGAYAPSAAKPVVFHLHGRWTERVESTGSGSRTRFEKYDSMVLTEDDYLDFLVNVSREIAVSPTDSNARTALPLALRTAFKKKSLFFIGYSLSDVNFLFILRPLRQTLQPSQRVQHVAVQIDPEALPHGLNQATYRANVERYFDWTYRVNVLWRKADEIAADLRRQLELPAWPG